MFIEHDVFLIYGTRRYNHIVKYIVRSQVTLHDKSLLSPEQLLEMLFVLM